MNQETTIATLGSMEPKDLDAGLLRKDLAALWREKGSAVEAMGAVTRACVSTLVIAWSPGGPIEDLVLDLIAVHPSRVILIGQDPSRKPGHVRAWVSAACSKRPGGNAFVCSEAVNMEAGPDTDGRVASAVRSLSVGGLPVYVLSLTRSPLALGWIPRLEGLAHTVLGDSSQLDRDGVIGLWERCTAVDDGTYQDISWTALGDWRRAVALWFDRPGEGPALNRIQKVSLEVADSEGGRSKAWLFLGWLGSRLGWERSPGGPIPAGFQMNTPGGAIEVEIHDTVTANDPALIFSVDISFKNSKPSLKWRRVSEERAIVVEAGPDQTRRFRLNQTKTNTAEAIDRMFSRSGPDPVARSAMDAAIGLARGLDTR